MASEMIILRVLMGQKTEHVEKVFVFQYFWASPSGLRASWWPPRASWGTPEATWPVLGAYLVSPWGVLGGVLDTKMLEDSSKISSRSLQDRSKTPPKTSSSIGPT